MSCLTKLKGVLFDKILYSFLIVFKSSEKISFKNTFIRFFVSFSCPRILFCCFSTKKVFIKLELKLSVFVWFYNLKLIFLHVYPNIVLHAVQITKNCDKMKHFRSNYSVFKYIFSKCIYSYPSKINQIKILTKVNLLSFFWCQTKIWIVFLMSHMITLFRPIIPKVKTKKKFLLGWKFFWTQIIDSRVLSFNLSYCTWNILPLGGGCFIMTMLFRTTIFVVWRSVLLKSQLSPFLSLRNYLFLLVPFYLLFFWQRLFSISFIPQFIHISPFL